MEQFIVGVTLINFFFNALLKCQHLLAAGLIMTSDINNRSGLTWPCRRAQIKWLLWRALADLAAALPMEALEMEAHSGPRRTPKYHACMITIQLVTKGEGKSSK